MKNIVWLVSYPKSGNTWLRIFLSNYLHNAQEPISIDDIESTPVSNSSSDFEEVIGLNPNEMDPDEIDFYRPEMYRVLSMEAEKMGGISYKKTHDAYTINTNNVPVFPDDISKMALYIIRNPLDVCVSFANQSGHKAASVVKLITSEKAQIAVKKLGQFRQKLLSWNGHVQSWQQQSLIPVHLIRYEDMLMNPAEAFGSMVKSLELDYDEERLSRAIGFSNFDLLKKMEDQNGFPEKLQTVRNFFWKGKIGNYREILTTEQIQRIVDHNYVSMKQFGYIDEFGNLTV